MASSRSFSTRKIVGFIILLVIVAFVFAESLWKVYLVNKSYTIYFPRSVTVTEEAYTIVDEATAILQQDDTIKLRIVGHTSPEGDEAANMELSLKRANIIKDEFVYRGISESRIEIEAMAGREPLEKEQGESTRSYQLRSSRVELVLARITKNPLDYVTQ